MEKRIGYFPRQPRFPILLDTGTELLAFRTAAECEAHLPLLALAGDPRLVIDALAESFAFYPDLDTVAPMIVIRDRTKAEIVALYHARKRPEAPTYTRSLASRKLADVVSDIADLLRPKRAATRARPLETKTRGSVE